MRALPAIALAATALLGACASQPAVSQGTDGLYAFRYDVKDPASGRSERIDVLEQAHAAGASRLGVNAPPGAGRGLGVLVMQSACELQRRRGAAAFVMERDPLDLWLFHVTFLDAEPAGPRETGKITSRQCAAASLLRP